KFPLLLAMLVVSLVAASTAYGQANIVIRIDPTEPAGTGFTDATPVAPVGGNPGTTLGQQRLNAFQFAASIWGASLNSNLTITVNSKWDPSMECTATTATLGSAGAASLRQSFLN